MLNRYSLYSLLPHNTFGIDVKAAQFVEFDSEEELVDLIQSGISLPVLTIGAGSNLLFMNDYKGTVLHSRIFGVEVVSESDNDLLLRVGSGMNWDNLVAYTVEMGWQGLENLSIIPGEVGASAIQNVGAYGVEAGDCIECVDAISLLDGSKRCFSNYECCYSYRNSIFKMEEKGKYVITYVTYRLRKNPEYTLDYANLCELVAEKGAPTPALIREIIKEIRSAKLPDPAVLGSAGSYFMNPVVSQEHAAELAMQYPQMPQYDTADGKKKLSAAWLIDTCGWKGKKIGAVGVYQKQPLVIVNHGGATGQEILDFSSQIVASVKEKFGVTLVREVNVIE